MTIKKKIAKAAGSSLDRLCEKLDSIEKRLETLEQTPAMQREARMVRVDRQRLAQERSEQQRLDERRAKAAPQRRHRFETFMRERLDFGPGRACQPGLVVKAYNDWCNEQEPLVAAMERYTSDELIQTIEDLPDVEPGIVRSHLGGKINGLIGAAVQEPYRDPRDASQDDALIAGEKREAKRRAAPA